MPNLPKNLTLPQTQTQWAAILNPFLSNPSLNSVLLQNISLSTGSNIVNHMLGRKLQGWRIVRLRASAMVYDTQDSNPNQTLTLLLTSSATVVIDLECF